jgi:hypothetical protein
MQNRFSTYCYKSVFWSFIVVRAKLTQNNWTARVELCEKVYVFDRGCKPTNKTNYHVIHRRWYDIQLESESTKSLRLLPSVILNGVLPRVTPLMPWLNKYHLSNGTAKKQLHPWPQNQNAIQRTGPIAVEQDGVKWVRGDCTYCVIEYNSLCHE